MKRKNIMLDSTESKEKVYEEIHQLFLQGKRVELEEHRSGFPAVTVDCEEHHNITDILSLEQWWRKHKRATALEVMESDRKSEARRDALDQLAERNKGLEPCPEDLLRQQEEDRL